MTLRPLLAISIILVSSMSAAEDPADIQAFNEAWSEYRAAVDTAQVDQQIDASRRALKTARRLFPESDATLPLLMKQHGAALINGKKQVEAQPILHEALELAEAIHGKSAVELIPTLTSLAQSYSTTQGSESVRYYKRALNIAKKNYGRDSEKYAALAFAAGAALYSQGEASESKNYLNSALTYYRNAKGETAFETGLAHYHIAKTYFSQRKYKLATEHLTDSLAAFQGDDERSIEFQLHTRALMVQVYERMDKSDLATEHCIAIGRLSKLRGDQDYLPLFRMAPTYPNSMLSQGREGFVDIAFTVDKLGFTKDPQVIDSTKRGDSFEVAALEAVERFRYAPRFVDGRAVSVDDVKTRITFSLE